MKHARIAVVGAGPAGLTAAIAAHQLGLDVTVFEQASDFLQIGGGLMIQSNGLRVLECLDLFDSFRPSLRLTKHLRVESTRGRPLLVADLDRLSVPHNNAAVVPRYELQEHLLTAALRLGVPVRFDHRLTGVAGDDAGSALRFADGEEFEADVVVACDGAHSRVRESFGLQARRRAVGQGALRCIVPVRTADETIREIWGRDGRMFGICPLPGERTYFFCTLPAGQWHTILAGNLDNWVSGWAPFGKEAMRLMRAVPDWTRVNYAELEEVRLDRWYRPPVFVTGDAAHAMAPNLGQGANCAMVDALVLMRMLARARDTGESLDKVGRAYDELRRPFVTRIQSTAWQIGGISRVTSVLVRGAALWTVRQSGWLQRRSMATAAGYNPAEDAFFDRAPGNGNVQTTEPGLVSRVGG